MLICPACKYSRGKNKENDRIVNEANEPFIQIHGEFTMNTYHGHVKHVDLMACPKCNAAFIEK